MNRVKFDFQTAHSTPTRYQLICVESLAPLVSKHSMTKTPSFFSYFEHLCEISRKLILQSYSSSFAVPVTIV